MARKFGSTRRLVSSVVAPIKSMGACLLTLMMLAACSSPPTSTATEAPTPAAVAEAASAPATQDANALPTRTASSAEVDASQLPEDVRDFILKQRMCRHFSRTEAEGGNPAMARVMCVGADEAAWKALIRKYQDNEAIASVLLAERPPSEAAK